jgi:hypothetical protein
MQVLDVHYRHYYDGNSVDLNQVMLPFSIEFFTEGLGTFFVGLVVVVSVGVIQWHPTFANQSWNKVFLARYALMLVIFFALFELVVKPTELTIETLRNYEGYSAYVGYCVLHILGVLCGWLGATCLASELFGEGGHFRRKVVEAGPLRVT